MKVKKLLSNSLSSEQIRSIAWRLLSIVASSIYFANIPVLLFLIYMQQHGLFSYDFYERGLFGLRVFFAFIVLSVLVFGVALWAFLFPVVQYRARKEPMNWKQFSGLLPMSLLFWIIIILLTTGDDSPDWHLLFYVILLSLLVAIQVGMIVGASARAQFYSLAVTMLLSLVLTVQLRVAASGLVGRALAAFGVGGEVCTEISDITQTYSIFGNLVLAAPEYIYVKELNRDGITAIRVDSSTTYRVFRGRCEGVANLKNGGNEGEEPTPELRPNGETRTPTILPAESASPWFAGRRNRDAETGTQKPGRRNRDTHDLPG